MVGSVSDSTHRRMSAVSSENTEIEIAVQDALQYFGIDHRLHARELPGVPDIVIDADRIALFVNGCFWHGHKVCSKGRRRPVTNQEFWEKKIAYNRRRAAAACRALRKAKWKLVLLWECQIRDQDWLNRELRAVLKVQ